MFNRLHKGTKEQNYEVGGLLYVYGYKQGYNSPEQLYVSLFKNRPSEIRITIETSRRNHDTNGIIEETVLWKRILNQRFDLMDFLMEIVTDKYNYTVLSILLDFIIAPKIAWAVTPSRNRISNHSIRLCAPTKFKGKEPAFLKPFVIGIPLFNYSPYSYSMMTKEELVGPKGRVLSLVRFPTIPESVWKERNLEAVDEFAGDFWDHLTKLQKNIEDYLGVVNTFTVPLT